MHPRIGLKSILQRICGSIQGLNMAATQAAADTLFSSEEMRPILKQAVRPDGSVKSFELLVETSSIGATAPGAQIIATRFYP
jgi:hypothetical protein